MHIYKLLSNSKGACVSAMSLNKLHFVYISLDRFVPNEDSTFWNLLHKDFFFVSSLKDN